MSNLAEYVMPEDEAQRLTNRILRFKAGETFPEPK